MRINIAASHRFHLLDLARELSNSGHDVTFYSYVPTKRAMKFGLPKDVSKSLFIIMIPFLTMLKLSKGATWALKLKHLMLDILVSLFMKKCDVFIGLAPVYKRTFKAAKRRYNAIIILDWGSKHIEEQQKILSALPNYQKQDNFFIQRCLWQYLFADYIALPSLHTKESFISRGIKEEKILLNPYAVNLKMFGPTKIELERPFDIIMVGGWSYRKGCDMLIELCRTGKYTLLHVGGIKDIEFPKLSNMTHIDAVDESELKKYYAQAKIFVLPSREEGLALVQPQAIVCGLPLVCSKHTGGGDLRNLIEEKNWIIEMTEYSLDELDRCVVDALNLAKTQVGVRQYAKDVQRLLTWEAYGNRYNDNLNLIFDREIKV